jgi:alanyl-tRNA synthetase
LVEIAGCDLSACGGTHVTRTGAIGVIGVTTSERYKGGTRVGFVCGERALRAFQLLRHQVRRSVTLLSVGPAELADAVERSQRERQAQRRVVRALRERLVSTDAVELMAMGQSVGGATLVLATRSGHDAKSLMSIAVRVARAPGHVVVLVSDTRPVSLVVSRSADVDLDANAVVGAVTARWDARGGGRRDLAQAGGLDADPSEVLATAGTLVNESLAG